MLLIKYLCCHQRPSAAERNDSADCHSLTWVLLLHPLYCSKHVGTPDLTYAVFAGYTAPLHHLAEIK